tara:strand:+ start:93 stop:452 length:360 start_codon:yes stop_codon:yes gene_type:complete
MNLNYFSLSEFDSPDLPNSGVNMDQRFLTQLEQAREYAGIPFRITSGYRTELRNEQVGGVSNSSHIRGCASDISCGSSSDKFTIVQALLDAGFNRIGIASNFIHVDNDPGKPANVIWTY